MCLASLQTDHQSGCRHHRPCWLYTAAARKTTGDPVFNHISKTTTTHLEKFKLSRPSNDCDNIGNLLLTQRRLQNHQRCRRTTPTSARSLARVSTRRASAPAASRRTLTVKWTALDEANIVPRIRPEPLLRLHHSD